MQTAAKIVSLLFHPLILPTYAFLLIYWTNPLLFSNYDPTELVRIFVTVFINTFLFPVIAILLIWRLGFVKSLYMESQQERMVPYLTSGAMYIWTYVVFRKSGLPEILSIVILGATITLFACFMITIFRKVSIHTASMACLFILTFAMCLLAQTDYTLLLMATALMAGVVGSSRILTGAHDLNEIALGYFIGLMSQLVALKFY
ncbi:MAG TPA: hypothetical protein PLD84_00400 [Chitinophagales bacterium]|nr:hypothetical protein [Chitinophagales bacterium]